MILSDRTLSQMFPKSKTVGPASIDVHLAGTLDVWPDYITRDPRYDQSKLWKAVPLQNVGNGDVWLIEPNHRYLAATIETVHIPDDAAGQIDGRSSWGRDGLEIHRTAGWLDPGFHGVVTLELSVVGSKLVIWPGARIAQIVFHQLDHPAILPYVGKYQGATGPDASRMHLEVRNG